MPTAATLAVWVLAWADPASACTVCYGSEGSDMTTGMNNGILSLLGVIAFVQLGFVGLFGSIWYRTRKLRKLREQFHIIGGER
ncbi:MAG: hypothetical protein IH936_09970 [Acidobacteria bacterium]|nr:hypothetical protein [Acidobacteriota bacterium]